MSKNFSHVKTSIKYYIIFSTKYKRKCLSEISNSVLSAFKEVEEHSNFKILYIKLDKNCVHLLVQFKPHWSIEQVVKRLKQVSTQNIWRDNEDWLKKFYWNKKRTLWSCGYFVSTIGNIPDEILKFFKSV